MSKHELPSGAILEVTPLPFEQAWDVAQSLSKIVGTIKVDLNAFGGEQPNVENPTELLEKLSGPLCELLASPIVLNAAKLCLKKCAYNGHKINDLDLAFESAAARGDFIPACFHAIRENVTPFFAGIGSFLSSAK